MIIPSFSETYILTPGEMEEFYSQVTSHEFEIVNGQWSILLNLPFPDGEFWQVDCLKLPNPLRAYKSTQKWGRSLRRFRGRWDDWQETGCDNIRCSIFDGIKPGTYKFHIMNAANNALTRNVYSESISTKAYP